MIHSVDRDEVYSELGLVEAQAAACGRALVEARAAYFIPFIRLEFGDAGIFTSTTVSAGAGNYPNTTSCDLMLVDKPDKEDYDPPLPPGTSPMHVETC
jgi:hypothetical protein